MEEGKEEDDDDAEGSDSESDNKIDRGLVEFFRIFKVYST